MAASSRLSKRNTVQTQLATSKPSSKPQDTKHTRATRRGVIVVEEQLDAKRPSSRVIATSKSLQNILTRDSQDNSRPPSHPNNHHLRDRSPPSPRSRRRAPRAPLSVQQTGNNRNEFDDHHDGQTRHHDLDLDQSPRPLKKAKIDQGVPRSKSSYAPLSEWRESPDPLNVIPSPPRTSHTRTRANTIATTAQKPRHNGRYVGIAEQPAHELTEKRSQKAANARTRSVQVAEEIEARPTTTNGLITSTEKRTLRSQDGGSRSKSELAMYFPNYEQMISLEPEQRDEIAPETVVSLIDDLTESPLKGFPPSSSPSRTRKSRPKQQQQISPFGNPLANLHECEVIQLPSPTDLGPGVDPLSDAVYFKAHRRHERQEKQLRNIEKERAQHEKVQLDRLLDELQGHDWLRVMGISGITETEKKLYEPKRDLFVREVSALIDKFRAWKEEEKRRKLEKDQAILEAQLLAADAEAPDRRETTQETGVDIGGEAADIENGEANEDVEMKEGDSGVQPSSSDAQSYGEPPDPNDVDAWAARQLLQEARSASGPKNPRKRAVDDEPTPQHAVAQAPPPPPEKPFTSFYSKKYLRDAAVARRRRGRFHMAFGHPVPELEEREFALPDDILTAEVLTSLERKRRRLKRESKG